MVASWPGAACMLDCSDVDPDDLPEELAGETDFIKVSCCLLFCLSACVCQPARQLGQQLSSEVSAC